MYIEVPTKQFKKKDLKMSVKQGKDLNILETVLDIIKEGNPLPEQYREHYLSNNYKVVENVI